MLLYQHGAETTAETQPSGGLSVTTYTVSRKNRATFLDYKLTTTSVFLDEILRFLYQ